MFGQRVICPSDPAYYIEDCRISEHQAQLFYAGCKSGLEGGQCICQGLLLPSVYFRVTWKQGVIV